MIKIFLVSICAALGLVAAASAQIYIGQTSGFTGQVAGQVKEVTFGATLYLEKISAEGGINGQKIELINMDDKFDPKLAVENTRKLITEKKVIAMFLNRGTPTVVAILPLLEEFKVPLIAPSTGAIVLHQPVQPWVFNVRAPYWREAEKAVLLLSSLSMTKIGLIHVNNAFGDDLLVGALSGFKKTQLQPLFDERYEFENSDFTQIVKKTVATDPQAILVLGNTTAITKLMPMIRAAGSKAQIVSTSNNASSSLIKTLGPYARGTVITQVFPSERALAVPMVKELSDLAAKKGTPEISPAMLEGYAGAKVLVEGLRRAGKKVTSESLTRALNGMSNVDIGGLKVSYSPTSHTGIEFVDLSIISHDGKFTR